MLALLVAGPAASAEAACHGDCSQDGDVSPAELRRIVDIINLCGGNPQGCPAVPGPDKQCTVADADENGNLTAEDLTRIIAQDVIAENPDCAGGTPLGTRVFTIRQKSGFNPATGFFSSGNLGGEVTVANSWYIAQTLNLRAGAVNETTGIASVRLEQDVIFGGQVIQGGPTLCVKLHAAGSTGQIDCDGGSPQDVVLAVDSNSGPSPCATPAPSGPDPCRAGSPTTTAYTGTASRAGGLTLQVMATVDNISPALASPADCATHEFGTPTPFVFTTERASAEVDEISPSTVIRFCSLDPLTSCSLAGGCPAGKGTCSQTMTRLSRVGVNFNCAMWTTTDGPGRLVTPLFGEDTPVGDTGNILLIGD